MLRYRQVHDFWHVLFGLDSITVESELALKCIEYAQTGLTMTLLASLFGPLKLDAERRDVLLTQIAPWALQSGAKASFLLNVYYEKELDKPLDVLQKELNITPLPKDLRDRFLQLHHSSSNKRL